MEKNNAHFEGESLSKIISQDSATKVAQLKSFKTEFTLVHLYFQFIGPMQKTLNKARPIQKAFFLTFRDNEASHNSLKTAFMH